MTIISYNCNNVVRIGKPDSNTSPTKTGRILWTKFISAIIRKVSDSYQPQLEMHVIKTSSNSTEIQSYTCNNNNFWAEVPDFKSGISHNDPDALQDHCATMQKTQDREGNLPQRQKRSYQKNNQDKIIHKDISHYVIYTSHYYSMSVCNLYQPSFEM